LWPDATPSPDGRFFAATDWDTGNLIVRDLSTGKKRQITSDASWGNPSAYGEASAISPDGKSVAYGWYSEKADSWELRIAGISGADSGKIHTVYSTPHSEFVGAQAWTPDGAEVITILMPRAGVNQIASIRASDGTSRILRTVDWRYPENMAVSPDGRWLAYDFPTDGSDRDIHLIGLDGTRDRVIAQYKGDDVVMGWTGNEGRLLIGSERSGTPAVWSLRIVNGTVVGEPVLVRANMWRTIPVAASRAGPIFYLVSTGDRGIYTAPIDPSTAAITSPGVLVTGENEKTWPPSSGWSANGEYIAYVVQRGGDAHAMGQSDVMVRSIKTGNARRLSPRMSRIIKVQWMPDGRALLVQGADDTGHYGLFRMDIGNASLKLLLPAKAGRAYPRSTTVSADGKQIFFMTSDSTDLILNVLDARGKVFALRRFKNAEVSAGLALSPDGRTVAIGSRGAMLGKSRLTIASLDGGPEREVFRAATGEEISFSGIAWTPDGRHIIFAVGQGANGDVQEIRKFSLEDGNISSTGFRRPALQTLRISPDGRTLLFGVDNYSLEMWAMDPPVFGSAVAGIGAVK
jgi:Tol biopolymer transport system component